MARVAEEHFEARGSSAILAALAMQEVKERDLLPEAIRLQQRELESNLSLMQFELATSAQKEPAPEPEQSAHSIG